MRLGLLAPLKRALRRGAASLISPYLWMLVGDIGAVDKGTQVLLSLRYRELARAGGQLPAIDEVGFRSFSQTDEDGVLLYIFSLIGQRTRSTVEICAGDGIECLSANWIVNHGWRALLIDGDTRNVAAARRFYGRHRDTYLRPPTVLQAWVDRENVNGLVASRGFAGEIDLLALDLDGVDYWIWRAIERVTPRVVAVEYNWLWPDEAHVSVPYRRDFAWAYRDRPDYWGASLGAFVRLGREKGYRLVGCNRYGYNAFFVRRGLGEDLLPEVAPSACLGRFASEEERRRRLAAIADLEWVEV